MSSTRYISDSFFDHLIDLPFPKVSDSRIVIAVDASESSSDDMDLPERCRVLKLANSVTYDRLVIIPTFRVMSYCGLS